MTVVTLNHLPKQCPRPRIVFMGTPTFALKSLEVCLSLGEVITVITQPDRQRGRGYTTSFSPVKQLSLEKSLPILQPQTLRSAGFSETLRKMHPDVVVVTAYGHILPKDVLNVPPYGCINVHASLLPRFRGAAPIQWAIASGDVRTGISLMKMDEGMDTGAIIDLERVPILADDTAVTLHDKLAVLGAKVLTSALPKYLAGKLKPVPQSKEGVVLAPMLRKADGKCNFMRPAMELQRQTRAFIPWPGTFTRLNDMTLKIHRTRVQHGHGKPGTVLSANSTGIEVACGEGSLVLEKLQPEGRRIMTVGEFLAGHPIPVGSRFQCA